MANGTNGVAVFTLPTYLLGISAPNSPIATTGTAGFTLPSYTIEAFDSRFILPSYTLTASGVNGTKGTMSKSLPALLMAGSGTSNNEGFADFSLPALILVAEGINGTAGNLSGNIGRFSMTGQGISGTAGNAALVIPAFSMSSDGSSFTSGTATITLPMFMMEGYGSSPDSTAYTTLAMNSNSAALTSYDNFPFNSMATFNGVTLAAGDGGIYALGGTLDDTAQIISTVRLGIFDFGSDKLKRVDSCYFAYRSDGDLTVRMTLDDDTQYEYTLESTGQEGIYTNRLKMGKGCQGRYFQAEIESMGNPFVLDSVDLKAQELSRRV